MAKRMGYAVIGLPHYTIWHLYEPSVDDIRHAEVGEYLAIRSSSRVEAVSLTRTQELEQERQAQNQRDQDRAVKEKKITEQFMDPNGQWNKDREDMQALVSDSERMEQQKSLVDHPRGTET